MLQKRKWYTAKVDMEIEYQGVFTHMFKWSKTIYNWTA